MKRISELFDEIRKLDAIDIDCIARDHCEDYSEIFSKMEELFKEFYISGYENNNIDPDIDFKNRLSNFYQFDCA